MAHNIEITKSGASFFSANQPAWHNLGKVVTGAQTWEQAMKLANLDFTVEKLPLINPISNEALPDVYGVFRTDTQAYLGTVGERYTPIQNEFVFDFMDAVIGGDSDGAHYETAGVLGKGERVFVLANLTSEHDIHGSGDKHRAYLCAVASHDGSMSLRIFVTDVRVVCANTVQIALGKSKGSGVSVRHTVNAEARLNSKLENLVGARMVFTSTMEKLEFLAEKQVNVKVVDEILTDVFKLKDLETASTRAKNSVELVKQLLEVNDNNAFPEFRGTAYNLLNAVTEYTDHYREVRKTTGKAGLEEVELRADGAMFGTGADFKTHALDTILKRAETLKTHSLHRTYSVGKASGANVLDDILSQA